MATNLPALVWNQGIAALCDHRVPDEFRAGDYRLRPELASRYLHPHTRADLMDPTSLPLRIAAGELVWVRLSWLASFIAQALPHIDTDFVLVTGDSDQSVPSQIFSFAPAIVEHPRVLHWFAQNGSADGLRFRLCRSASTFTPSANGRTGANR